MTTLIVNCATCEARGGPCSDCVISTLLGPPDAAAPPSLSGEEQRVLGLFAGAGMLPPLRLVESRASLYDEVGGAGSARFAAGDPGSGDFDPIGQWRSG